MERTRAAVVGGGQAGLAASHELAARGVEHVVLERGRVGQTWRDRWDSFCLVTPNWTVQLPGGAYEGQDPHGFMPRDEIVAFLENYAACVPVREGVEVEAVERGVGGFVLRTSAGDLAAESLVVATGTYRRPHLPAAAAALPESLSRLTADDYRSPATLPDGAVLVIGSGQSGCQIAEELHEAGREVVLACGRAPWSPRRVGDRDFVWWLVQTGFLDATADSLPGPEARLFANVLATGRDGGHDLHLRVLRKLGVTLAGRLVGAADGVARLAPDLVDSVAWGDERYLQLRELFRKHGLGADLPDPAPFDGAAPQTVDLRGFGAAIFTTGFRPDYAAWLPWPEAFDPQGFPIQTEGESTAVPGLFFLGTHFLRKRKSSLLLGVGEDAAIVAERIALYA